MPADGRPHVLVVGPGAIGGFVAVLLERGGTPVTVAVRSTEARQLLAGGLEATDHAGKVHRAKPHVITSPAELQTEPDWIVLTPKVQDAPDALGTWSAAFPDTTVVAMQNGIIGPELQKIHARLIDCVVTFPATLAAPGRSVQTGPGGFVLGAWDRRPDFDIAPIAWTLRTVGKARVTNNIAGARWTKLLINSSINTLGVVAGTGLAELLRHAPARDAFLHVATEGYRAGRAEGVRFEPIHGFRPRTFALPDGGGWARRWRHWLLLALARKHGRHRSSSLQSLDRGQTTEVDHLNGHIVATAKRHGQDAPVNARLVELVHEIEAGKRAPSLDNLLALAS